MAKWKSSLRHFTVATMSVMEFLCHKLQPICSICHNHNPVLSSVMTYCQLCSKSNKTGATYGAGFAYPQRTTKFTSGFYWVSRCSIFCFLCNVFQIVVCPFGLFHLVIVLSVLLRFTAYGSPFGIFKYFISWDGYLKTHHIEM